jgi:hypothetical protein
MRVEFVIYYCDYIVVMTFGFFLCGKYIHCTIGSTVNIFCQVNKLNLS